jgi:hypothetical protein
MGYRIPWPWEGRGEPVANVAGAVARGARGVARKHCGTTWRGICDGYPGGARPGRCNQRNQRNHCRGRGGWQRTRVRPEGQGRACGRQCAAPPPYLFLPVTLVILVTARPIILKSLPFSAQTGVTTRPALLVTLVTPAPPITPAAWFPINWQTARGLSSITGNAAQYVFPVARRPGPSLSEELAAV